MRTMIGSIAYSQDSTFTVTATQLKEVRIMTINYNECKEINASYLDVMQQQEKQIKDYRYMISEKDSQYNSCLQLNKNEQQASEIYRGQILELNKDVKSQRTQKFIFQLLFVICASIAIAK